MRSLFPSEADRLVYQTGLAAGLPLNNANGVNILIYIDEACTTLADVLNEDLTPNPAAIFEVGLDSQVPSFLGPDGVTELYARPENQEGLGYRITPRIVLDDLALAAHTHPASSLVFEPTDLTSSPSLYPVGVSTATWGGSTPGAPTTGAYTTTTFVRSGAAIYQLASERDASPEGNEGFFWRTGYVGGTPEWSAWQQVRAVGSTVVRIPHTFTISGEVKIAVGDESYIPPFFISEPAGQTVTLAKTRVRINSGTSVSFELKKNGVTFYGPANVTTTTSEPGPSGEAFADGDALALVVTAVAGTPKNMTVTVYLDYTV